MSQNTETKLQTNKIFNPHIIHRYADGQFDACKSKSDPLEYFYFNMRRHSLSLAEKLIKQPTPHYNRLKEALHLIDRYIKDLCTDDACWVDKIAAERARDLLLDPEKGELIRYNEETQPVAKAPGVKPTPKVLSYLIYLGIQKNSDRKSRNAIRDFIKPNGGLNSFLDERLLNTDNSSFTESELKSKSAFHFDLLKLPTPSLSHERWEQGHISNFKEKAFIYFEENLHKDFLHFELDTQSFTREQISIAFENVCKSAFYFSDNYAFDRNAKSLDEVFQYNCEFYFNSSKPPKV